jgi:predicted regulator of Ras-like GTPase activity (Roadblock/LC7/MglB family)
MTFREILQQLVEDTPGALAAALMGADGIPIDAYRAPGSRLDLPALAVEFQRVLEEARKTSSALYGGGRDTLAELILNTSQNQLLFREVDPEYFVVVALEPTGSLGKARYLVRSLLQDLRREL